MFRSPPLSKTTSPAAEQVPVLTRPCQNGVMASPRRVLLVGLDGFVVFFAQQFADEGLFTNFARLHNQGASFNLDHGRDKYSGLAWEHLSSGIRPRDGGRWSAVTFNQRTYRATQD